MAEPSSPSLPLPPPLPHLPASLAHTSCRVLSGVTEPMGSSWQEEQSSQGWGWSWRMREAVGQGPLLSLPSPCSCQRCYRKVRIHSVTPSALRCMLREGSRGVAHAGWNVGISSTSGGNNSPLFLFPDNMWEEPVCWPCLQPSSSPCPAPAGSVLLPGRLSLTLAVSTAALCTEISTECLEQGRCCSWGQGAQIHHSSPPLPECRLSHELGGDGTVLHLHT